MWSCDYFNPAAETFSWRNAYLLACASELAYEEAGKIEPQVRKTWGFDEFEFFDEEDTQAFVASGGGAVIACFRGTEISQLTDVFTDLDMSLVDGPWGGKVHEGFYDALSKVYRQIDGAIDSAIARTKRKYGIATFWATGHSLGAALATLLVARRLERGKPAQGLYTFGQPRTGDRKFARNFDFEFRSSTFRFVNSNDIVTRIPQRIVGYEHCGSFRYFDHSGAYSNQIGFWRSFLNRCQGSVIGLLNGEIDDVSDHSMSRYRNLIEKEVEALDKKQILKLPVARERRQPRLAGPRRRAA
ncbi:MAG: lipase family protein [bacterium]|nr:lipase family protein [bacterium]